MIRATLLLIFVLLPVDRAEAIELTVANYKSKDREISIDIEHKLEALIRLDTEKISRDSIGAVFDHKLDLESSGETGWKSQSYFIRKLLNVSYLLEFDVDRIPGEFEIGFRWRTDDLPQVQSVEPPSKVCISVSKLLKNADSDGWKYLTVGKDYTTRPAYYMSKEPTWTLQAVDRLLLVSSKNSDCLVSLDRSRSSVRPPL